MAIIVPDHYRGAIHVRATRSCDVHPDPADCSGRVILCEFHHPVTGVLGELDACFAGRREAEAAAAVRYGWAS